MDALTGSAGADHLASPFEVRFPAGTPRPLIFASPHSGRLYPDALMAASRLDADQIRRSEDAHVDDLIEGGVDHGATLILGRFARAYVDLNRDAYELDQAMFEDELPAFARGGGPRVAAGLGSIAKVVGEGQEIYGRKLTFDEARRRIEHVHAPYHAALRDLIDSALDQHERVLVVDWHSMPSAAARTAQGQTCDFVLGDRYGAACEERITQAAERALCGLGYRVARNNPYAGGYTTEHYGRPDKQVFALQIEINRGLYLDEASLTTTAAFAPLKRDLGALFGALSGAI